MLLLKFRRKQPAHRDVGDRCQPLGFGSRRHVAEGFAAGFRKRRATIGENESGCDLGMANGHLQRHEAAIAIAEHGDVVSTSGIRHSLSHSVGDIGEISADRPGPSEAGQFGNDHPERLR